MSVDVDARWAVRFALTVRQAALREYSKRSCIETTRVGDLVADYFGVAWEPVPVRMGIATREWFNSGGELGWSVGCAATGKIDYAGNSWDGHLTGHLGGRYLVDLAADQLHRPDRGITVDAPLVLPIPLDELDQEVAMGDSRTGLVYMYQRVVDPQWKHLPAWRITSRTRRVAGNAIRVLRQAEEVVLL